MLLATLILDREPMQWAELPQALIGWLQSAGAIAAIALFLVFALRASFRFDKIFNPYGEPVMSRGAVGLGVLLGIFAGPLWAILFLLRLRGRRGEVSATPMGKQISPGLLLLGKTLTLLSWALFAVLLLLAFRSLLGVRDAQALLPGTNPEGPTIGDWIFAAAGGLSLLVVVFPVLRAVVVDLRLGRVWAIARLSIKEAIRNRSLAVFGVMALIFLFADWFITYRPEDQLRNYVWVLYWTMFPLFLLSAAILGSFSIPNDIKNQTIHTVVTKPVTKFEIVLGRFLGYGLLLTASLMVVGVLSLGYIWRGLTDEARAESLLARVPVYGNLGFINTKGDSVGREWDYRKYIAGQAGAAPDKRQYAVWMFPDLSEVQPREDGTVRVEFDFDIFRLTKGEENKGVFITLKFADGKTPINIAEKQLELRRKEKDRRQSEARKNAGGAPIDYAVLNPKIEAELLKEFPVFEEAGVEVFDYQTKKVDIPFALVERLRELDRKEPADAAGRKPPAMQVFVNIDSDRGSAAQMLGVARRDLYILAAENNFYINFLKGLVGLWFSTLMVLGVAVCCSTYLSGVISLLVTLFLFLTGFFLPSLQQLANNQVTGGGPAEAFSRIVSRTNMVMPLDDSPTTTVIHRVDDIFRWQLRRILTLIPDASRYDLHPYVANGFDISVSRVLVIDCFLPLVGYLLPWFILAYYLINYREIANPT